jgi:diguanylate cyclase (GGDEF)-like protein
VKRLAGLLLCALVAAAAGPAHAGDGRPELDLGPTLDRFVRLGEEQPQAALKGLGGIPVDSARQQRRRLLARGLVLASNGLDHDSRLVADELRLLDPAQHGAAGRAAGELVLATLSDTQGRPDLAETHARAAIDASDEACAAASTSDVDCDLRLHWAAATLRQRAAAGRGAAVEARQHAEVARNAALRADDRYRLARTEAAFALLAAQAGDAADAAERLGAAQALARGLVDAELGVRLAQHEAAVAAALGNETAARRATDTGLAIARSAGLGRLEAMLWVNLSDHELKAGHPAAALAAALRALPVMRRHLDVRSERTLLHNAGLAKIGLGRLAEGKRDVETALALWSKTGALAETSSALREYGTALTAAGDVAGAIDLFHRERQLVADAMAANRAAALAELGTRFERDTQQREIELRSRDNAVQAAQLANREWAQRVWALLAAVALLAVVLIVLLLRRMRETQRELKSRQATLRVQSERDTLTGLANRRHFQQVMAEQSKRDASGGFGGTLLLVDIDHFKHINDGHGHGVGDAVLVEVARRLGAAVREGDLVARWGGEEFIVYAPAIGADAVDALAARVLGGIGGEDIRVDKASLRVTASIGYGRFPLPPHRVPIGWEQALNLADMALYTAKSQGRNLALGIASVAARDDTALRAVEADFELAWQEGRAALTRLPGPAAPPAVPLAEAA